MEDDDIDTEMTQATGALPGTSYGAAPGDIGALYQRQQKLVEKQILDNMTALTEAQARLREQRVGPSAAERLFAISAALTRPTRTGQFGEMMGNLGTVLGAQEKEKRAAEMERESLLEKYGMQIGEKQLQLLQQGLTGTGQLYRAALAANKSAGAPQFYASPTGGLTPKPGTGGQPQYPGVDENGVYIIEDPRQLQFLPANTPVRRPGDPTVKFTRSPRGG